MRLKKPVKKRPTIQWEDADARRLWIWACHIPVLREHLYHIPNGGRRNKKEAARMNGMGVRAGVNDYHLPVPRGGYHGLWVELKATPPHNAAVTKPQKEWVEKMRQQGHAAYVCKGWVAAKAAFTWYLGLPAPDISEPQSEGLYFESSANSQ